MERFRRMKMAKKKKSSVINCPDCGKLISVRFPLHICNPPIKDEWTEELIMEKYRLMTGMRYGRIMALCQQYDITPEKVSEILRKRGIYS
jgi:hypothetical protein